MWHIKMIISGGIRGCNTLKQYLISFCTWHVREEQDTLIEVVPQQTVSDLGEEGQPNTERKTLVS